MIIKTYPLNSHKKPKSHWILNKAAVDAKNKYCLFNIANTTENLKY